jgi:uncharacterized protein (TIGR03067 family)
MRLLILILSLVLTASCHNTKKATTKPNPLNGNWVPIKEEIAGTSLPPAAFQTQKLQLADSNYTFTAESVDKGVVRYNGDKMDIYGREGVNAGKHFTAIYKMENDQLTICYNLAGDAYPDAYDTKGKPRNFLCVFKKQ